MPDASTLEILRQLREMRDLSQADMATHFGFIGNSARNRMSRWENGAEVPPIKYRDRFVTYLIDKLDLKDNLERFDEVWLMLCKEWKWPSLTESERQKLLNANSTTGNHSSEYQEMNDNAFDEDDAALAEEVEGTDSNQDEDKENSNVVLAIKQQLESLRDLFDDIELTQITTRVLSSFDDQIRDILKRVIALPPEETEKLISRSAVIDFLRQARVELAVARDLHTSNENELEETRRSFYSCIMQFQNRLAKVVSYM